MRLDTAGYHAAAVEEDEARQWFDPGICGCIKTVGNIADRPRQQAIDPGHVSDISAGELHEFCERLPALLGAILGSILGAWP